MSQKLIRELSPGESILAFYILRKKELRQKKGSNENYLAVEFGDQSGRIQGTMWENFSEAYKQVNPADVVKIKGKVTTFRDKPQITVEKIRKATAQDGVLAEQFLPKTNKNVEDMFAQLKKLLSGISDPHLKKLNNLFIKDDKFVADFSRAPGGKLWHHAYVGGLLEHTLSVVNIADMLTKHYGSQINRDILLSGAFLHDVGKIEEFSTAGYIDYSTPGRLVGHISIGLDMVTEKIASIEKFPAALKDQVLHCVLSHHGEREKGSPVQPMTREALILSYADELDSMFGAFQRIITNEKEPGKVWSNYVNLIDRFVYLGEES